MAWWDHEELKAPKDRSDRYKVEFPSGYTTGEVVAAQMRLDASGHHSASSSATLEKDRSLEQIIELARQRVAQMSPEEYDRVMSVRRPETAQVPPAAATGGSARREWVVVKNGYFYGPASAGYTSSLANAGRFTEEEARAEAARRDVFAVHESAYRLLVPLPVTLRSAIMFALEPLVEIADAYDANELDDEARRWWGDEFNRNYTTRKPEDTELYAGRGGRRLLTLADCLRAREVRRMLDR